MSKRPRISEGEDFANRARALFWGKELVVDTSFGRHLVAPDFYPMGNLLIREEYVGIYRSIQTSLDLKQRAVRGRVLWGQPGIGKSAFLFYALAVALSEKRPVAWCIEERLGYLFLDDGVEAFELTSIPKVEQPLLFLFDETPPGPGFYLAHHHCFIVQATSPRRSRYTAWAKQRRADYWVMGLWSKEELEAEVNYKRINDPDSVPANPSTYEPLEAYNLVGPSARNCLDAPFNKSNFADASDASVLADFGLTTPLEELLEHPQSLVNMLRGQEVPEAFQCAGFHQIFFAYPSAPLAQPSRTLQFRYATPTPLLHRAVVALIRQQNARKQVEMAQTFASQPVILGIWFEAHAINKILSDGIRIKVNGDITQIAPPTKAALYDTATELEVGVLYVPNSKVFPTLDAFLLTDDHDVVLFQATVSPTHPYKGDGINQVVTSLKKRRTLSIHQWSFVFVFGTPGEDSGQKLCSSFTAAVKVSVRTSSRLAEGGSNSAKGVPLQVGYAVIGLESKLPSLLEKFDVDVVAFDPTALKESLMLDTESLEEQVGVTGR